MEAPAATIHDVDEAGFASQVVERSKELPVVVDFWAEWCGPCRQLTPALEKAVHARPGKVELAKVDTDRNQGLAQRYRVQGIPAVKAFQGGDVAAEFTGAIPPAEVERFFDALVPSEADELARAGDEDSLRRALELDPRHLEARRELGRILLRRADRDAARDVLQGITGDFVGEGLAARAELDGPADAFAAWDQDDPERALDLLQREIGDEQDPTRRDRLRAVMVAIFTELGPESELARTHRRRLAAVL